MQPKTKMSSGQATFDLKAARQMCAELPGRDKLPLPDRIDREERVLRLFPAALDEIERLQADIITHDDAWHNDRAANAKRIAELEEENRQLVRQIMTDDDKDRLITKQHTALKKLGQVKRERGKALVDARQQSLAHYPSDFDSPRWEELEKAAREQLRQEDKL